MIADVSLTTQPLPVELEYTYIRNIYIFLIIKYISDTHIFFFTYSYIYFIYLIYIVLIIKLPNWQQPICYSVHKWTKKLSYVQTTESDLVIKRFGTKKKCVIKVERIRY